MSNIKAYAWYFPNWHPNEMNDRWHGKGWTEWECVKCARPRFEGHLQPKVPLWGYEDESDPKVFEKKIATAHKYGIDGFIFDFYWYKEGPYRRDCLDKGFLGASNNTDVEFSVMWCNHNPVYIHPALYMHDNAQLLDGSVDDKLFFAVTQYCIDNYFGKENYQKVDGKAFFGIWNVETLIENFGGAQNLAEKFVDFRERAKQKGIELHISINGETIPGYWTKDKKQGDKVLEILGVDSAFSYSWPFIAPEKWPQIEYSAIRDKYFADLKAETDFVGIPLNTTVSTGWDSSPRTVQSEMYEDAGYPYMPVQVGNTPQEVGKAFQMAKQYIDSENHTGKFFTITTWNEWTEGNYLEPDELYGYGYLEEFNKAFRGGKLND